MPRKEATPTPRQALLAIEKKIYRQNRETIIEFTEVQDKNFKKYYREYRKAVRTFQRRASQEEVEKDIAKARFALVGDYHTLDQSQRSFVRTLRSYIRNHDKEIVVALETVEHRHQKFLDAFMRGEIDHATFVKKIGFKESWFFDLWENYTVIFDFLKYHKIRIFGIEANNYRDKSLLERDRFMAQRLVNLAKRFPHKKIFVLVGDLHLAPAHLPREIIKVSNSPLPVRQAGNPLLSRGGSVVTLYQNSPDIYWKLSEKNMVDHTLIVKVAPNAYCRMHTPPIIVQQSYINWLYHEEGNFDWVDARGSFLTIVQQVAELLDLKLPPDDEDVEVYTCGDLGFMKLLNRRKIFSAHELKVIRHQIEHSQSYFLSRARIVYIANVSINHAAEEASHYLKHLMTGEEFPRSHRDAFYANVLHEALGFFGSKIINNKRKCARRKDYVSEKDYLEKAGLMTKRGLEYETACLFLEQAKEINKGRLLRTNKIAGFSTELFMSLTHALGYDLGDGLYYGFMDGRVPKEVMHDLFVNPFKEEGEPGRVYITLVKALKNVKRAEGN